LRQTGLTERAGFEPAWGFKPPTAFPVLLLQPLGHLSRAIGILAEETPQFHGGEAGH
jgi:hypothetical protein